MNKYVRNIIKKALLTVVLANVNSPVFCQEQGVVERNSMDAVASSRLAVLLGGDQSSGFPQVVGPRPFAFPADHGPHPDYRNEWWYFTGNLDTADDRRFGYELTIFRFAVTPHRELVGGQDSVWKTNQVFVAHFAITDVLAGEFHAAERYARGAAGLAGATAVPFRVWLEDWGITVMNERDSWRLTAQEGDLKLDLELVPAKAPVANGVDGYSQKSATAGNASYYYSMTRLETSGTLRTGNAEYNVTGLSWLDREWGSGALSADQAGWDWFAFQLSDGRDLMFYNIRRSDGKRDPYSAGTLTNANGSSEYLDADAVEIRVTRHWQNENGDRYPLGWEIRMPGKEIRLVVTPVIDNQELVTIVRYWEGAVDVVGESSGKAVSGRGYVELTGYAR